MPIKWGQNQDHHLLLKILETHPNIKIDCEKVAEAWSDGPTKPTARAVKERLANIRKIAKTGAAASGRTGTAANGVNGNAPGASISATPVRNGNAGMGLPTPPTTSSRKRRSFSESEEDELTDESDGDEYPVDVNTFFKTPSKSMDKRRLRAVPPRKYTAEGEEELGNVMSDDSDFDPNAERKKEESMARRRRGIMGDSSDEC